MTEVVKCLGLVLSCVLLVLLVPSSAWAGDTASPEPSPSSSPSAGSPTPESTPTEPTPSVPSPSATETVTETPTPTPTVTETVTETAAPEPTTGPTEVTLSDRDMSVFLLTGCLLVVCASLSAVMSFRS